jgi:hypothetical protein
MLPRRYPHLCLVLLLLACGCGRSTTVSGTVTWEGKPLAKGWITFHPADQKGVACGGEVIDGSYCVKQVPPGKKRVRLSNLHEAERVTDKGGTQRVRLLRSRDEIPADAVGNDQVVEVTGGTQVLDFELKKPSR